MTGFLKLHKKDMIEAIVSSSKPITLVGGGVASVADLKEACALAPTCVAVDGGLALAMAAGTQVSALIGDFDSVLPADLDNIPENNRFYIAEQDSTDFGKALRNIHAPVVLAVGFMGGRIDHQLAAFHVLTAHPDRPCILVGDTEIVCLCPPEMALSAKIGQIVSLFPMRPVSGTSAGLRWPIDGLAFDPIRKIGTSNIADGEIHLTMERPDMLVILPRSLLEPLMRMLELAPHAARWPARAEQCTDPTQS